VQTAMRSLLPPPVVPTTGRGRREGGGTARVD
jgi:hypothetical protein